MLKKFSNTWPNLWSLLLFVVMGLLFTLFLGKHPIYILDEARNAEAAREMLINGDYILPKFNGNLRTDKPPLHYFFMVLAFKIFGVNAFAARFFSGIFGILTFIISYRFTNRYVDRFTANILIGVLISAPMFVQEFRLAVPDPYLIFFTTWALFMFFEWVESKNLKFLALFYIALALGTLAKGPVAVFLPAISIFLFLLLRNKLNLIYSKIVFHFLGVVLYILIAFPWFYLVDQESLGLWTKGFFLEHNIQRYANGLEGHNGSILKMIGFIILGLLPFSVFLFSAFRFVLTNKKSDNFTIYALSISVVYIVFFSFSGTQLPNYPMPAFPFIAVLIAIFLRQFKDYKSEQLWRRFRGYGYFLLAITFLIPISGMIILSRIPEFYSLRMLSLYFSIIPITTGVALYLIKSNRVKFAFISFSVGWILMSIMLHGVIYPQVAQKTPLVGAKEILKPEKKILVFKRMDSSFPFNLARVLPVVENVNEIKQYLVSNPGALILTNHKDIELDTLRGLNLIYSKKSPFENHVTRIFEVSP